MMWTQIIQLLKSVGLSQQALAERVGVDQSTICRLADGRAPEPRFSVGLALIEMAGGAEKLERVHGIRVGNFCRCGDQVIQNVAERVDS
jgi:predicted transcriptional regulator